MKKYMFKHLCCLCVSGRCSAKESCSFAAAVLAVPLLTAGMAGPARAGLCTAAGVCLTGGASRVLGMPSGGWLAGGRCRQRRRVAFIAGRRDLMRALMRRLFHVAAVGRAVF